MSDQDIYIIFSSKSGSDDNYLQALERNHHIIMGIFKEDSYQTKLI